MRLNPKKRPEKEVNCFYGDDNAPTWRDRLKNTMGWCAASNLADKIHGKHPNRGHLDAQQLLEDLNRKKFLENDGGEAEEDRQFGKAKFD